MAGTHKYLVPGGALPLREDEWRFVRARTTMVATPSAIEATVGILAFAEATHVLQAGLSQIHAMVGGIWMRTDGVVVISALPSAIQAEVGQLAFNIAQHTLVAEPSAIEAAAGSLSLVTSPLVSVVLDAGPGVIQAIVGELEFEDKADLCCAVTWEVGCTPCGWYTRCCNERD